MPYSQDDIDIPVWRLLLWTCLGILLSSVLLVLPWRWVAPPTTAFMLAEQISSDKKPAYQWVDREDIPPYLAIAVIAAEDQKFPGHYGFDLESIQDALEQPAGRRRGASTITQQVAKNLFLCNGRSYVRKAIEAWFTVLIETLWPKERILEIYLNIAEFGPGFYGVGAASAALGKSPNELTQYECTLLAAVLPNPKQMLITAPSDYVQRRTSVINRHIQRLGGTGFLKKLE